MKLISYVLTITLALAILMDFSLPGNAMTEEIKSIHKEKQSYNNAGGNFHYVHTINTTNHKFPVSEVFAKSHKHKNISFTTSLIFEEINEYSSSNFKNSSHYSLRIASGLTLPVIVILVLLVSLKLKKRMDTLVFVLQAVMVADLIFLLL